MAPGLMIIALLVVGAIVIGGVTLLSGGHFTRRQAEAQKDAKNQDVEMLRYRVPEGQDPAMVLAALQKEGFDAVPDVQGAGPSHDVLVPCVDGVERHRAHVRSVIQSVEEVNSTGDRRQLPRVKFADE